MECEEKIIDLRNPGPVYATEGQKTSKLLFALQQTMPGTPEYLQIMRELFRGQIGEGSFVATPISSIACAENVHIGNHVFVNGGCLFMARGGIYLEDHVQIAANVQLISNNHDPYDRMLLLCKPVVIREDAWIGAGATILPGVCVGKHAIVGAGSVVTKDIPDYGVAVGNPAKVIRMLDPEKFESPEQSNQSEM